MRLDGVNFVTTRPGTSSAVNFLVQIEPFFEQSAQAWNLKQRENFLPLFRFLFELTNWTEELSFLSFSVNILTEQHNNTMKLV